MKNKLDSLFFTEQTLFVLAICAGASQIALMADANLIFASPRRVKRSGMEIFMIDFEEELKKFHPSPEMEDMEDAIYSQDVTDLADVLVKLVRDANETPAAADLGE